MNRRSGRARRATWVASIVCTTAASIAAVLAAAGATSAPRPEVGPPRRFTVPASTDLRFPNGFTLTLVPYGTMPTARVELVVGAGSADDPADQVGVATLVGDYLREGSQARDATAIAIMAAELGVVGGDIDVTVRANETLVRSEVLSESTPALVRLVADVVLKPAFPPAALSRLATDQARRLTSRRGQAGVMAAARVNALLFPNHPADRMDAMKELPALSHTAVQQFHAQFFIPARMHLYVAGRFDAAAVEAAARAAFGGGAPGVPTAAGDDDVASVLPAPSLGTDHEQGIHLIDRPGATQARIQLSAPVVDPSHDDYRILNQLNLLLGSVQTSRIIANVRERHGWSYNVGSRLQARRGSSQWALSADVATDVVAPALREMRAELARVVAEPPPVDELRRFQAFSSGLSISENASPSGILDTRRWFDSYGVDRALRARYMEDIGKVVPADIQRVARTYLQPDRMVIVVVGDRAKLARQLAAVGAITD